MKHFLPAITLVLAPFAATAQSADGLGGVPLPQESTPAPAAEATPAAAPKAEKATAGETSVAIMPSRYAGLDTPAHVETMLARLSIQSRKTDPFGRFQDPELRPPPRAITQSTPTRRVAASEPPAPFADVIAALQITTIRPAHQMFLCENRSFRKGDILSLDLPNGKRVRAQVLLVRGGSIEFYNPDTKERATFKLNALPPGMVRGNDGRALPPGVQNEDSNAPLKIQLSTPLSGGLPGNR